VFGLQGNPFVIVPAKPLVNLSMIAVGGINDICPNLARFESLCKPLVLPGASGICTSTHAPGITDQEGSMP